MEGYPIFLSFLFCKVTWKRTKWIKQPFTLYSSPSADSNFQCWSSFWIIANTRCGNHSNPYLSWIKLTWCFKITWLVLVVLALKVWDVSQSELQKCYAELSLLLFFVEKKNLSSVVLCSEIFCGKSVEISPGWNREHSHSWLLTATHSLQYPICQSPAYSVNEK